MKTISPALDAHLKQTPTTVTTMWKITRMDGQVFGFTEHDEDITYLGQLYKSTGGFNKSAIKSSGSFATDNMEVNGFLSDDTIADDEIRNGAFDFAEVEIFLINYMNHSMGDLKLRFGYFGEVRTAPSGMFLVELRGLVDLLGQRVGEVYTPECRVDLGSPKCGIKLSPDEHIAGRPYKSGDRVLFPVDSARKPDVRIGPMNGGFETGSFANWNAAYASIIQGTLNVDPITGSTYFARHTWSGSYTRQQVPLEIGPVTASEISTGRMKLRVSFYANSLEYGQSVAMQLIWRTSPSGSGGVIQTDTLDFGRIIPEHFWVRCLEEVPIPSNARSVEIRPYISEIVPYSTFDCGFDNFELTALFDNPVEDYSIYGGVEFMCTTAGVTDNTAPTFDTTLGNTTEDGTVVWTAVIPEHMFLDTVAIDAVNSTQITVSSLNKPDGWFNWGVCKILSGTNVGKAIEVLSWNNTTKVLTLAMPLPTQCQAGDVFVVHTGCDKGRGVCFAKFNNILNFRGEPDVPGMSQYFKVAGMS